MRKGEAGAIPAVRAHRIVEAASHIPLEFSHKPRAFLGCASHGVAMTRHRQQVRPSFRRNAAVRDTAVSICKILLFASLLGVSRVAVGDGKPAGSASTAGPKTVPRAFETPAFEPGVLGGQVVLADGKPVADAVVLLRGKKERETRTDGQGRFRIESLAPGRYVVWAVEGNLVSPTHRSMGRSIVGVQGGRFEPS
jgi:hypothetical protein